MGKVFAKRNPKAMKTSIDELTILQIFELSALVKNNCDEMPTLEEAAQELAKTLYEVFINNEDENEVALCRVFKSCLYKEFPKEIKEAVDQKNGGKTMSDQNNFLMLMGTYGEKEEWRAREKSKDHQAFPLYDSQVIKNAPMMSALFDQIGFAVTPSAQLDSSILLNKQDKDFGVFLVEQAKGSKLVPAQKEFVEPFGVESVLGFGGMYSTSNIFAVIVFSKKRISPKTAKLFWSLAPVFKLVMLENELLGNIFTTQSKISRNISLELAVEINKEKTETVEDEFSRAKAALIELTKELSETNSDLLNEITERKRAEGELQKAHDELEMRVKERTQDLMNVNRRLEDEMGEHQRAKIKLQQYSKELERSNQDLEDFAYIASHDLQAPLRKVITFGDRLNEEYSSILGKRGQDILRRIENSTQHMRNFISDLLEYSRVNAGVRKFKTINLNEIGKEVISILEESINQSVGKVEFKRLPNIEADKMQMSQLFQNLIANALKFHKLGVAPVITISSRDLKNGLHEISISDNGIGFDEKYLEKIFKPFGRLHGQSKFQGTGIGLALCKKIVQRYGGTLTAKSIMGEGSTFIITLPEKQPEN